MTRPDPPQRGEPDWGAALGGLLVVLCFAGLIGWVFWLAGSDAPDRTWSEKPVDRPRPCQSY